MVQFDIVKQLIDAGANVNATDSRGDSGLHQAICFRNESARKCLKLLLSAGASLNIANHAGETPLLRAVKYGDPVSVQELMNAGANIDPVNSQPGIRLHMALLQKDWNTVQSLLENGAPTDYVNISGDTALTLAVASGKVEIVKLLIDSGADVNYRHKKKNGHVKSPLHGAVRRCNVEIVKMLLERGADPNRANAERYSVLSTATRIKRNRILILNLLLDNGADMYNSGFPSRTSYEEISDLPFEGMVESNDVEGVRLFLERGFDMNKYQAPQSRFDRSTALLVAIEIRDKESPSSYKDTRMLSLLIDHYRAKGTLSTELKRNLGESSLPLFCAIRLSYYERAAVLLEAGADPNFEDGRGHTALEYALFDDFSHLHAKGIQILIESGAHLRDFVERLLEEVDAVDERDMWDDEDSDVSSDPGGWDPDDEDREDFDPDHRRQLYAGSPRRRARRSLQKVMCIIKPRVLYESRVSVDDPIFPKIRNHDMPSHHYDDCKAEIDLLRNRQFDNLVTYYDVLTDKEFWRHVKSSDAFERASREFCISTATSKRIIQYLDDLKSRWETGYNKYKLWKPAIKGLARLLKVNKDSFHLILSNILNCLMDVEDWRSLSQI